MASEAGVCLALSEVAVFLSYFDDLPDVRQAGKVMYPLDEVLLLCLLAVLAGAETVNFTTIKHIALNLIRRAKSKDSIRLRRKVAAWDDEFLARLITA